MEQLLVSIVLVFFGIRFPRALAANPAVPALFSFGDSILDTGNNNHLATMTKCNYPPYGRDFPGGVPTGRFCNGKNPTDLIGILRFMNVHACIIDNQSNNMFHDIYEFHIVNIVEMFDNEVMTDLNIVHAASALGVKDTVPAYLSTTLTPQDLATGVSFASGGSGLDDLTSQIQVYIYIYVYYTFTAF